CDPRLDAGQGRDVGGIDGDAHRAGAGVQQAFAGAVALGVRHRGGDGGVAAEAHFRQRAVVADVERAGFVARHQECGFGIAECRGDVLHRGFVHAARVQYHAGRIATAAVGGERAVVQDAGVRDVGHCATTGCNGTTRRRRKNWVGMPTPSANTTVPMPNTPPSAMPATSTLTSIPVRTSRIDQPVRRARPVINPSRGPGPSCAPMYRPVANAHTSTPASMKATRSRRWSGVDSSARLRSAKGPMSRVLATVPRPGLCRSGIQASSTATEARIITVPKLNGRCSATPWWNTSQGEAPIAPRIISATDRPYSHRPMPSLSRRSGMRPARSWASGPRLARAV